jgi:hypothetical protein
MYYATGLPGWMRNGGNAAPFPKFDADAEKQVLQNRADALQSELEDIKRRLAEKEA